MKTIKIGDGYPGNSWVNVADLPGDAYISSNNISFLAHNLIFGAELLVMRDTLEGETVHGMLADQPVSNTTRVRLLYLLDQMILRHSDPTDVRSTMQTLREECIETGRAVQAAEIRNAMNYGA